MMLWFRFEQCFGLFTKLLLQVSSETGLFRNLFNHVLRGQYFEKYISYERHPFFENIQN